MLAKGAFLDIYFKMVISVILPNFYTFFVAKTWKTTLRLKFKTWKTTLSHGRIWPPGHPLIYLISPFHQEGDMTFFISPLDERVI